MAALEDDEFLRRTVADEPAGPPVLLPAVRKGSTSQYIPSHTNFVFVRLGPGAPAARQRLFEQGILVRSGAGYGLPEWVRVTIGNPEQNERFVAALEAELRR